MKTAQKIGFSLIALSLGGVAASLTPAITLESIYAIGQLKTQFVTRKNQETQLPSAAPKIYDPLISDTGERIEPADSEFSIIIPKIGVNAKVIPSVNPADTKAYEEALKTGVAHASTSFFPDEHGSVYLFSHSTNYDWFVRDLNAVFYLLKNLEAGDRILLTYQSKVYTYQLTEKRVVAPNEISYLMPMEEGRNLILQTCWPPGQTTQRLLILADLVDEQKL